MKYEDTNNLFIDERHDGVYVTSEDNRHPVRWGRTLEALHSLLARQGLKRIRKQAGSHIGGEYTK